MRPHIVSAKRCAIDRTLTIGPTKDYQIKQQASQSDINVMKLGWDIAGDSGAKLRKVSRFRHYRVEVPYILIGLANTTI